METNGQGRVVVGVDGSSGSTAALDWAVAEAAVREAVLQVVHCWSVPRIVELAELGVSTSAEERSYFEEQARKELDRTVDGALGRAASRPPKVERTVLRCAPAAGLITQSAVADLLVVGSRGRGGFSGLLLGSVSTQCLLHARCPVAVVPPGTAPETKARG
jgi:nucleotide-binding universal stress UspA family protein